MFMQHQVGPQWIFPWHATHNRSCPWGETLFRSFSVVYNFLTTTLSLKDVLLTTCGLLDKRKGHAGGVIAVPSRSCLQAPPAPFTGWVHPAGEGGVWHGTAQPSLKATLALRCLPGFAAVSLGQDKYITPLDPHIVYLSQIHITIYRLY